MRGLFVVALVLAVAACASPAPKPASPAGSGHIVVSLDVVPRPDEFFNSQHRARVVNAEGTVLADWEITDAAAPVEVPAGSLGLEAFTVFFSDWIQCSADPTAPGKEHCEAPTLGPSQVCQTRIELAVGATVEARFRSLAQGGCQLLGVPAAT